MEIKNLIRTSAQIVKITQLAKGNVVKLVEENSYSGATLSYAVVVDVLNDGEKGFVQLLKYKKSYEGSEVEYELLSEASDDFSLFPATVDEVKDFFSNIEGKIQDSLKEKEQELSELRHNYERTKEIFHKGLLGLTTPEYAESEKPLL